MFRFFFFIISIMIYLRKLWYLQKHPFVFNSNKVYDCKSYEECRNYCYSDRNVISDVTTMKKSDGQRK